MNDDNLAFYKSPYLTWFLLIVYPPIGIVFLWIMRHYDVFIRFCLSIFFGLIYLEFLGYYTSFVRAFIYILIFFYFVWRYCKIKEYVEKLTLLFNESRKNIEIQVIIKNFIMKYQSPSRSYNEYFYYELYLKEEFPIIFHHLKLSDKEELYINIIYHESDITKNIETSNNIDESENLNNYYKAKITDLAKIISIKLNLKGDKFLHYFTWELLKECSIDYYGDLFNDTYGIQFKDIDLMNLNDCLLRYVSYDAFHTDKNSTDLAMFTYYLMKYGIFKGNIDFLICLNEVHNNLETEIKRRGFQLFEKNLIYETKEIVKEIETIEVINEMKTKERFLIFIADLLKSLDYEVIQKPFNDYLDYIVSINNQSFGIYAIFQKDLTEKANIEAVQEMKLGLTYNELTKGIIITNGFFTTEAVNLADKNDIVLWNQEKLSEKSLFVKHYFKNKQRQIPVNEIKMDDILSIPFEKISIETIDLMSGIEFQYYIAELFKHKGYKITSIKEKKDYGVDIIIEQQGIKFGIQVKRSKSDVNSSAIKEIIAGLPYYDLQIGFAVTNNYFSKETIILANAFNIILWDRDQLIKEISAQISSHIT